MRYILYNIGDSVKIESQTNKEQSIFFLGAKNRKCIKKYLEELDSSE